MATSGSGDPSQRPQKKLKRRIAFVVGGIATVIGIFSGALAIQAGVLNLTASHYASPSNLKVDVKPFDITHAAWLLGPGDVVSLISPSKWCDDSKVQSLGQDAIVNPVYAVTITNNFTDGSTGQLYLDNLRVVTTESAPAPTETTVLNCPTAGDLTEASLGADLDHSGSVYRAQPGTGTELPNAGAVAFSIAPGETVSYELFLRATSRTYVTKVMGTLRNGNGEKWDVNLTAKHGDITVPGTAGVIFYVEPARDSADMYWMCSTVFPATINSMFECSMGITPTKERLAQAQLPSHQ